MDFTQFVEFLELENALLRDTKLLNRNDIGLFHHPESFSGILEECFFKSSQRSLRNNILSDFRAGRYTTPLEPINKAPNQWVHSSYK